MEDLKIKIEKVTYDEELAKQLTQEPMDHSDGLGEDVSVMKDVQVEE